MNTTEIRKNFPQLDGPGYHYLDSAATSLTPQCVLDAIIEYYVHYRANVHRAIFEEAVKATNKYEEARKKVAAFIGADDSAEVIFTSGATESSNILVRMLEETYRWEEKEKTIVTTMMEHHGALIPLQELSSRTDIPLLHIPLKNDELDMEAAERLINDNTILVSVMLASNVLGTINDVRRIGALAHEHGALLLVDATAAMGHIPVSVKDLGCDALYFSGHKMMAPTGIGVLWVRRKVLEKLSPAMFGGHAISTVTHEKARYAGIPDRFEPGTKNIAGAIGLGAAVEYLNKIGLENVHKHLAALSFEAIHKLEQIEGVHVISPCDPDKNIGIVSFYADWAHPHDIAEILARDRIAVRAGHHCAEPLHSALGISATVRASFHIYNTKEDIDALVEALKKTRDIFIE
jgi:cysteine desulfurase/selenocysteine lyase